MSTEEYIDAHIHPICMIAHAQHIWLGWRSVDEPSDAMIKRHGLIFWDRTKSGYIKNYLQLDKNAVFESETVINLDATVRSLDLHENLKASDIINSWNILTDLRNSLDVQKDAAFPLNDQRYIETYDRLFSNAPAASLIHFHAGELAEEDYKNAAKVIASGIAMLLNVTVLYQSEHKADWGLSKELCD